MLSFEEFKQKLNESIKEDNVEDFIEDLLSGIDVHSKEHIKSRVKDLSHNYQMANIVALVLFEKMGFKKDDMLQLKAVAEDWGHDFHDFTQQLILNDVLERGLGACYFLVYSPFIYKNWDKYKHRNILLFEINESAYNTFICHLLHLVAEHNKTGVNTCGIDSGDLKLVWETKSDFINWFSNLTIENFNSIMNYSDDILTKILQGYEDLLRKEKV